MLKIALIFVLCTLLFPGCYHAKQRMHDHSESIRNAIGRLPKKEILLLQSQLEDHFSLEGENISLACSLKMKKLLTTEIAQIFPMVDAMGKPGSGLFGGNFLWLGSFSECEKMKNFKYCLAGFELILAFFGKKAVDQQGVMGTCMPQQCNQEDIRLVMNKLPLSLNYPPFVKASITFPNQSVLSSYGSNVICEQRDESYSHGTIAMFIVCGLILGLCLFGTVFELLIDWIESPLACINQQNLFMTARHHAKQTNGFGSVTNMDDDYAKPSDDLEHLMSTSTSKESFKNHFISKLIASFSLVKNIKAVMNTDAPDRAILSINGIRTISIMWVILGHCYSIGEGEGGVVNPKDLLEVLQRFTFLSVDNAFFSVDSFFVLSGLLVSYLGLKRLESKGKLPVWQFYLHRYIRLTPSYGFVILFAIYILPLVGKGPLWSTIAKDLLLPPCKKYWWTNILYINNFYPTKMGDECVRWGWYLANDMQFYVISPIILYIMYKLGVIGALLSNGMLIAISACVTGGLMAHYKLDALLFVADINKLRKHGPSYMNIIYTKPYCRIQPYLVGMVLGYFLFKKHNFKGSLKWLFYLIGWAVAIALGLAVVYGTWGTSKPHGRPFTLTENIAYASLSRFAWALAVAWVIFACQNGFGGLVQRFLSWRAFIPLSRLTYGAYLIHPITVMVFFESKLSTRSYTDFDFAFQYVSITVMSYAAAFVLAITVEYPILSIDKLLFSSS